MLFPLLPTVDGLTPPTLVGLSSFAKSLKDQMDSLPEELQVELKLFSPTSYTSELRWEMLPTCGSVSEDGVSTIHSTLIDRFCFGMSLWW